MQHRDFKGIWIPKKIWLNKDLNVMEKLFLVEIDSLDNADGCFASNAHFSEFFGLSKNRCSEIIKSLESKNLIKIKLIRSGKKIEKRVLKLVDFKTDKEYSENRRGYSENRQTYSENRMGYSENTEGNNTINNTINNTSSFKEEKKVFEIIKNDNPLAFETIFNNSGFQQQLSITLQSENLKSDFQNDVRPILEKWMQSSYAAGNLNQPTSKLRQMASSYVITVMRNGGLKEQREEQKEVTPAYLRKIS